MKKLFGGELIDMTAEEEADFLLSLQPTPEDRIRAIRTRRDAAISAGITVAGMSVQTDDLSQQRITGAALAAMIDPTTTVNWKVADGQFVTLDAKTIIAVAQAVRAHVQACFDAEAKASELLSAGKDLTESDLTA